MCRSRFSSWVQALVEGASGAVLVVSSSDPILFIFCFVSGYMYPPAESKNLSFLRRNYIKNVGIYSQGVNHLSLVVEAASVPDVWEKNKPKPRRCRPHRKVMATLLDNLGRGNRWI